jgi:hypothetical protein
MSQQMIVKVTIGITAIALILVGAIIGRVAISIPFSSQNNAPKSTLIEQRSLSTTLLVTERLSSEQASAIALEAMPSAMLMLQPVLVRYAGQEAYQVTLDKGLVYVVYVDATSGSVIAETPPAPTPPGTTAKKDEESTEKSDGKSTEKSDDKSDDKESED